MTLTGADRLADLRAVVAVLEDPASLAHVSVDRSGEGAGGAIAVVRARSVDDVRATLAWASATGTPVVARGAGSALTGAASASPGAVVLDLAGLDRIVEIRPVNGVAVVQPGVVVADLDAAAAAHGLRYAPDPGSVGIATIGGTVATNAGGLRGAKYGVTRDAVLALDVVLADGRLVHLGRDTLKGVAGYDLVGLIVGSEGTLGVVVGVTVRLLPVPVATATATAVFATVREAAAAVVRITASGARPAVLELLDAATLRAIDAVDGTDLASGVGALLLVQTDGHGAAAELADAVAALQPTALEVRTASDDGEADRLLAVRRGALPAIERLGPVLIEDIAVPLSRLADAVSGVERIAAETGVPVFVFAHAGDGNLHPIVLATDRARAADAADRIFGLALELGGTITGEHGVGSLKRHWLEREVGADVLELQRRVKAVFDPQGILNPGKAL